MQEDSIMLVRQGDPPNLGQFAAVVTIASAVIQAGGTIGAAAIAADAQKYAIKKQTSADLQVALSRQQAELKAFELQMAMERATQEQETLRTTERTGATKQILTQYAPYVGLGLAGLGVLVVLTRRKPTPQYYGPQNYGPPPAGATTRVTA